MPRATKLQKNRDGKLVSAKAKSKDPACSAAASAFAKLRSGGTAPPDLYTTLAKCRAKARNNQSAANQRAAGNEGKAQVLEKRADRGLTGAQRIARAKELIAQRKAKAAPAPAAAKPSLREQADAARAAKGGRAERVEAVKSRMQSKYAAAKKADAKIGDKMASLHKQVGRAKSEGKDTAPLVSQMQSLNDASRAASRTRQNLEARASRVARIDTKAAPAKPSALEQARSARAAKGDRTTRLKALAERSMSLAESRATKAGSLSGAAQDRMIDRSMAAAGRYNRLEAARTPYTPSAKAKAPTPSRSTPERQAAVQAAKDRLFGSRLDRAFTKLEGPKGDNVQGLDRIRSAVPYKREEFDRMLQSQRREGRYSLMPFEGNVNGIPANLRDAAVVERGFKLAYISRRDAEPYTPRKAGLPAIKSGPPTTKGGVPAETPKVSLLEQARIKRAAKNADRNRDGRLAARAKKQYDAARRNMKSNLDKAKALGPGTGEKYVEKAAKYGKRLEVASKRFAKLHAMWATGGKFTQARVLN